MSDAKPISWEAAVLSLRMQPDKRDLVEACFYDDPLSVAAQRYHESSEWSALRGLLLGCSPARVLDVGAGRGISSYAFAKDGWKVTALEPDNSSVVGAGAIRLLAREAALDIDVVETWGEELPFASGSFELVHCRQVLHHARDLEQLCSELGRVLRPGGILISTREHVISRDADLQSFLDHHPLHKLYGGEHAYTLDRYCGAIRGAGLKLTKVLNPYQSDINLYPESMRGLKRRWAAKAHLPVLRWMPDSALAWIADRSDVPGRLFTFVAHKPGGG